MQTPAEARKPAAREARRLRWHSRRAESRPRARPLFSALRRRTNAFAALCDALAWTSRHRTDYAARSSTVNCSGEVFGPRTRLSNSKAAERSDCTSSLTQNSRRRSTHACAGLATVMRSALRDKAASPRPGLTRCNGLDRSRARQVLAPLLIDAMARHFALRSCNWRSMGVERLFGRKWRRTAKARL